MGIIQVLDRQVAQLIAAGEVVERPSSVIKELVENSIDAGASLVTVEIQRGGVTYMRVSDNGCGIAAEDVERVFLRHATSKVHTQEDLGRIATLGFRGEAMASIHAVCRLEMLTRPPQALEGTRYLSQGGEDTQISPAGCPAGTTIIARDLFFNTPARMKFLKKDVSEGNSVAGVMEKIALSHPEISFKLIRDGQLRLHTPGDGQLLSAIHGAFGREFAQGLLPVEYRQGGVEVRGYVTKPAAARSNRTMQSFFVNGRFVKSRTMMAAVEEAFKHSLMGGRFPGCVLCLTLPVTETDVNVHPSKIEVRFTDERPVFDAVYYGVKNALHRLDDSLHSCSREQGRPLTPLELELREEVAQTRLEEGPPTGDRWGRMDAESYREMVQGEKAAGKPLQETSRVPSAGGGQLTMADGTVPVYHTQRSITPCQPPEAGRGALPAPSSGPEPEGETPGEEMPALDVPAAGVAEEGLTEESRGWRTQEEQRAPEAAGALGTAQGEHRPFRLVGELFATYILLEQGDQVVLIDKHAAHERLLFNRLRTLPLGEQRQLLLEPVVVSLSWEDYQEASQRCEEFARVGFLVEDFGDGDLLVRETPVLLGEGDIRGMVEEIAHSLLLHRRDLTPQAVEELLHSVACKSAIKARDKTSPQELSQLVQLLEEDEDARYCPHGRPIAKRFSRRELEKLFGRIV